MRKCSITIKDKDYTIQVNRDSIVWLEARGFNIEEFAKKPITYIDILWTSGFLMNHPEVNSNLALKLMETYTEEGGDIMEIINFILEEYQSFISALSDTKSKKKATITEI
jgi:hypothetical protein